MKKPKILIALRENGENGGPYISHLRIAQNEYLKEKYDFEFLYVPRARVLVNPIGMRKFIQRIKKANADVVHIAGLQLEGYFTMKACQKARIKTVLAVHGSLEEARNISKLKKWFYSFFERYTMRKASISYGVSDYVSSWKICKKNNNYFGTIYNIPCFNSTTSISTIRDELNIPKSSIVIASTGRIIKDKGYDILCSVIKRIRKDIHFIIAGDGVYRNQMIDELSSYSNVHILGYRSDIDNILSGSDAFIICTRHETLCISLLEAAHHSLPLIATNVGGIPEIVDQNCGYLIENENIEGFVDAIYELTDVEKRECKGKAAKDKILDKFNQTTIEKQIDRLYSKVLGDNYEDTKI